MLGSAGFSDDSMITIAQDVSGEKEALKRNSLKEIRQNKETAQKYFSLMVAKRKNGS
jgi:hypothetical protein